MSETNGTALSTSADASAGLSAAARSGGLGPWLSRPDDTAPMDAVDRDGLPPAGRLAAADEPGELAAMRAELLVAQGRAALQRHPAWLDVLSDAEREHERAAVERLRTLHRDEQMAAATAAAKRSARERRAMDRQARLDLEDQLWQRRALARRRRLLDSTARLAALQRTHVLTSVLLIALAVAGIGWTSIGVHDALVGPDGSAFAYVVEPLFSLPLVVIMMLHARAAQWGRVFPNRDNRTKVRWLEVLLLGGTMLVNTAPVLPGLGHWQDTTTLLAHLAPPLLILVAVVLQPLAASFIAEVLVSAHVEATTGERRLSAETVDVLTLAKRIRDDWNAGQLRESTDGGPSIAHVRDRYGIAKERAQAAVDAWRSLLG